MEVLNSFFEESGAQGYGVIVFAVLAVVLSCMLAVRTVRMRRKSVRRAKGKERGVSVIITSHNCAEQLEKNLPYFLTQNYEDYEVIVVDDCSEDDTESVLGRLEEKNPRLRRAKVPLDAKFRSTKKLAVNIGVLSAKHDVLLFSEANCRPVSRNWVRSMQANLGEGNAVVVGFANYEAGEVPGYLRLFRALRFMKMSAGGRRWGKMGGDGCNMAYRKSDYLANRGFRNSQSYMGYDTDIVRDLAKFGPVVVTNDADAYVRMEQSECKSGGSEILYRCACEMSRPWRERMMASGYQGVRVLFYVFGGWLVSAGVWPLIVGGVLLFFLLSEFVLLNLCLCHLRQKRLWMISLVAVTVGVFYVWGVNVWLFLCRKRWR